MAIQNASGTTGGTELEFQVTDPECFFVWASEEAACQLTLEHLIHRSDGALLEFFAVEGADPNHVVGMAEDVSEIAEARVVRESRDGGLVEFVVSGACVTTTLADAGAVTREVTASEGTGRVVASVPSHADVRAVVERFRSEHAGSELLASREGVQPVPIGTELGLKETLAGRLTDRQVEVLRTAYLRGYFEWPRESSAEECAEALGITQPTFSQHMRAVQQAVAACLFEAATRR
ncbi:MAG: putative DNA binding protein [Natronomonas sp.]|jgi:predicted DNA binding protein